jgi:hypothetical protein
VECKKRKKIAAVENAIEPSVNTSLSQVLNDVVATPYVGEDNSGGGGGSSNDLLLSAKDVQELYEMVSQARVDKISMDNYVCNQTV